MGDPRIRTAWLAAALMVVATAAQVASLLDAGATLHARCAEHGELIHVGALATSGGDRVETPADADDHEHCALPVAVTSPATSGVDSTPATTVAAALPGPHRVDVLPGQPIWRLAPKNSPPSSL